MTENRPVESSDGGQSQGLLKVGILGRLRAYFFAGILVTTPVAVTMAIAWWFIGFVDSHVVPLIPAHWNPNTYFKDYFGVQIGVPGIGVLVLVVAITLIGALTAGFLGRYLVRTGERIVARMPIVRSIYGASKQILETVFRDQSEAFREAVLIEYPRPGLRTIAFITGRTAGEVQSLLPDDVVNVYVPTTPNPTSGFLLFVPAKDIIPLDMSVEEAVKMVISVGLVTPPHNPTKRKKSRLRPVAAADAPSAPPTAPESAVVNRNEE